jgi:hypothetical protein
MKENFWPDMYFEPHYQLILTEQKKLTQTTK